MEGIRVAISLVPWEPQPLFCCLCSTGLFDAAFKIQIKPESSYLPPYPSISYTVFSSSVFEFSDDDEEKAKVIKLDTTKYSHFSTFTFLLGSCTGHYHFELSFLLVMFEIEREREIVNCKDQLVS